jgi:hypothetical protein
VITQLKPIPEFLGLVTHIDPSQVPLGGVISCKNMAQFNIGRVQRIPGVSSVATPSVDAQVQVPLSFWARGLGASGEDRLVAVFVGVGAVSIVNLSTGAAMTGPALASPVFGKPWSAAFYNNKWMIGGGDNTSIYQLDSDSTYSAVTGTPTPPGGNLIKALLNRLYVADIAAEPGLVKYSDVLTTNFNALNILNVREIPGVIMSLAVNSPTTDTEGIGTQLIISKSNAMWSWDETNKDLISSVVGQASQAAGVNTEAGFIFLGKKGSRYSVFVLKIGTAGEPFDVGEPVKDILDGTTKIANPQLAHAVLHGRFYKLFFSTTGQNNNPNELWLDVYALATEQKVIWYGVHGRGSFDSSAVADSTLELLYRGAIGATRRFQENTSLASGFTGATGATLVAELDMCLGVDPMNDEKVYDLLELQIAKEANVSGNQLVYEPIAEGSSQGTQTISMFNNKPLGISRVAIPVRAQGQSGMAARDARLKLTHSLNARFDVLGGSLQYLINEDLENGGKIRKQP